MGKVARLINFMLAAVFLSWAISLDYTSLTTVQMVGVGAISIWFALKLHRIFRR
jgi:hypothetical protein